MSILSVIILIITLSFDNFSVGIAYGMKKTKFSLTSFLIIGGIATAASFSGIKLGGLLNAAISQHFGNILLTALGSWLVYTGFLHNRNKYRLSTTTDSNFRSFALNFCNIKYSNFVQKSSLNYISIWETIILALILSIDAFGISMGILLSESLKLIFPIIIGISTPIFLYLGIILGKKSGDIFPDYINILPGVIIIIYSIINIFLY